MTHYQLKSAVEIQGVVRVAGTTITAEEFATIQEEGQELLLRDSHVVACEAPTVAVPTSPFPRKRGPKPT